MSDNTYAAAGVSIEEGDRAVELFAPHAKRATRPEVRGGLGGFAGLFALGKYKEPMLAAGSDGVGTKLAVAQAMDKHDTIGQDLVGMVVDDIVVVGAQPLFMTDYIACGRVVPERIADIVRGVAEGCRLADTALVGGETAEHPGLLAADEYDVAGAATGVVEADMVLGAERVQSGDVVIGMASSGIHSNGYSLVRRVVNTAGWSLDREVTELGRTLGEELLEPTRIYAKDCLALAAETQVRTFCHVTGGGLAGNLERVVPNGLMAEIELRAAVAVQGECSPCVVLLGADDSVSRLELDELRRGWGENGGGELWPRQHCLYRQFSPHSALWAEGVLWLFAATEARRGDAPALPAPPAADGCSRSPGPSKPE